MPLVNNWTYPFGKSASPEQPTAGLAEMIQVPQEPPMPEGFTTPAKSNKPGFTGSLTDFIGALLPTSLKPAPPPPPPPVFDGGARDASRSADRFRRGRFLDAQNLY